MTGQTPAAQTFAEILWTRRDDAQGGIVFDDKNWNWAEVVQESLRRAALLERWRRGGEVLHIAVFLENTPDYVFWLGAAAFTGDVIVGVNPTRRGEQLAHDIRHTDCSVLVVEDATAHLLEGLDVGIPAERVLHVESHDHAGLLASVEPLRVPAEVAPERAFLLLFSSGSTGAPKAVICSQGRLGALAVALADRMRIQRASVTYLCMPLFHGNAIMTNLAPAIRSGATVVLARRFSASGFIRDVHRHGVTYWNYVGRALAYVLATAEQDTDRVNTLELAYGTEASAADVARFSERFDCEVMEGYGASEGGLRINRTPDTPAGSLGLPVGPRPLAIVDEETGRERAIVRFDAHGVPTNLDQAVGQMVVRGGAAAFEGYYKNPEATADRVRGEDFWTGDLAYRDAAGFVYFAGRTADWMRVDGENLAAAPVERLINRHPAISQCVVYSVPDVQTGDQVMATVELVSGASIDPVGFSEFLDAQQDMGTKWRPRYVRISEELPVTGNGKVARSDLRIEGWHTDDTVWEWARGEGYRVLEDERRREIDAELVRHGRADLIPTTVAR